MIKIYTKGDNMTSITKTLLLLSLSTVLVLSSTIHTKSKISHGDDDAEENSVTGKMYRYSQGLDLIKDNGQEFIVGLRFKNIKVPKGVTITNAYLQFTTEEINTEPTSLTIYGESSDKARRYTNRSRNISSRPKTVTSVPWNNIPAWEINREQGEKQKSPDLSTIIQELINMPSWEKGKAMGFVLSGSGKRVAKSYNSNHTYAPVLYIEYSNTPAIEPPINHTPTANAGSDMNTIINQPITITGTATDSDGSIVSYEWQEGNSVLATTASFDYIPTTVGEHRLILTAMDNDGATGSDHLTIRVEDNNTEIDLTKGLVAHYEFEGNANDSSGNGNDGIEHGGMSYVEGVIGQAGSFDGVDDYINIGDIYFNKNTTTISMWIKSKSSNLGDFLSKHSREEDVSLLIKQEADGKYDAEWTIGNEFYDLSRDSSGLYNDNIGLIKPSNDKFDHLVLIYDGNQILFYVNNRLVKKISSVNGTISSNSYDAIIGAYSANTNSEHSVFLIDDLRIYNRALNQTEMAELYKMGENSIDSDADGVSDNNGLKGTYYGVNTQLENISQFRSIIENNESVTTSIFTATKLDYGYGTGTVSRGDNLQRFFLKEDATSLSNDPKDTTDGGINLLGKIYLNAGTYNFRVRSDDGYQIKIDGISVAEADHNQAPTTTTHSSFVIDEDGYHDIDIVWWDQGIEYVFKVELSDDDGLTYTIIDSNILSY